MIDNLITNAIKYSHAGGQVRVRCPSPNGPGSPGDQVVLSVADDGIGIAEEDLAQLFTKFFRTHEAQRRAIQGIGLGLSISKSIINGHDGTIEVHSEPRVGTTFEVRLPLVDRETSDAMAELPRRRGAPTPDPRRAAHRLAGPGCAARSGTLDPCARP